jgi:lycopene cyclase domain-containing protein
MISTYLIINILIIIVPLLLTFEKKIKFYKKLPALAVSIIIVGGTFILWDIIATYRGDWDFNPQYLVGIEIFNLPIEEILFFITVPYSAIFLYETGKIYLKNITFHANKTIVLAIALILIVIGLMFNEQYYSLTVLFFSGLFLIVSSIFNSKIQVLNSSLYWSWILFMYLPFFIVNYFLTSLPIVTYSPAAIWGIRITTIPFEDFFYSFSMLSFYLYVYMIVKEKWLKENE